MTKELEVCFKVILKLIPDIPEANKQTKWLKCREQQEKLLTRLLKQTIVILCVNEIIR